MEQGKTAAKSVHHFSPGLPPSWMYLPCRALNSIATIGSKQDASIYHCDMDAKDESLPHARHVHVIGSLQFRSLVIVERPESEPLLVLLAALVALSRWKNMGRLRLRVVDLAGLGGLGVRKNSVRDWAGCSALDMSHRMSSRTLACQCRLQTLGRRRNSGRGE